MDFNDKFNPFYGYEKMIKNIDRSLKIPTGIDLAIQSISNINKIDRYISNTNNIQKYIEASSVIGVKGSLGFNIPVIDKYIESINNMHKSIGISSTIEAVTALGARMPSMEKYMSNMNIIEKSIGSSRFTGMGTGNTEYTNPVNWLANPFIGGSLNTFFDTLRMQSQLIGVNSNSYDFSQAISASIDIDIAATNNPETILNEIQSIVDESQEYLQAISDSSVDLFKLFTALLSRIYNSAHAKNFTSNLLSGILVTIITAKVLGIGDGSVQNIDNRVITNNTITQNINNGCPVTISVIEKELRFRAIHKSKLLCKIPANTELSIIKKYRTWMVVSFIDNEGNWQTGYTTIEGTDLNITAK